MPEAKAEDPIPQGLTRDVEVYFLHPFVSLRYQPQPQPAIVLFKHRVDAYGAVGSLVSQELNPLRGMRIPPRLCFLIENAPVEVLGGFVIFMVAVQDQVFQIILRPLNCILTGNPDAGPIPAVESVGVLKLPFR